MANEVESFIKADGNQAAHQAFRGLVKSLLEKGADSNPHSDLQTCVEAIAEATYGEGVLDDANTATDLFGSKWVYMEDMENDDELKLVSAWRPPYQLIGQICLLLLDADKEALVLYDYRDEMPNFFGAGLICERNGEFINLDEEWEKPERDDETGELAADEIYQRIVTDEEEYDVDWGEINIIQSEMEQRLRAQLTDRNS